MKTLILISAITLALVAMSFSNSETDSYSNDNSTEYIELDDTTKKKKKRRFKEKLLKGTKGLRSAATGETKTEESKTGLTISEEAVEEEEEEK